MNIRIDPRFIIVIISSTEKGVCNRFVFMGMYVDNDYKEDMEDSELYDSLSIQYDEGNEIDWDSLATTLGNVKGGDLRPFISRLRFADAMGLRE